MSIYANTLATNSDKTSKVLRRQLNTHVSFCCAYIHTLEIRVLKAYIIYETYMKLVKCNISAHVRQ